MNKWIVAVAVILPTLIEIIDTSVVNVSLDHIRGSLSAGIDEATWSITAYLVANAVIIPMAGWLSRVFGRKNYLVASVTLFTVASFLCGSSHTLGQLIFFRIVQGLAGGALQPLSQAILLETFPATQQGMAMALFGIGVMFGPIVGPVLGGWITDNWSWNWIFYINIPVGIVSVLILMLVIKDPPYLKRVRSKIDYWGLTLITVGLGCLQIVLDKGQREDWFSSAFIVRLSIISALALIAFVIVEWRAPEPVVNLRVFKHHSFSTGNVILFLAFFVLFGSIVLIPMYVQQLMGYNAFLAGLALAPGGIATLIAMPTAARLSLKFDQRWILVVALFITAYSTYLMMLFNLSTDFEAVSWARIVMGIGMGLLFIPLQGLTLFMIPKEEMGNATSIVNLLRNLGGSFGVAFVTTTLAQRAQFHQARLSEHLNVFDPHYQVMAGKVAAAVQQHGAPAAAGDVYIYQRLVQQANMGAFMDAFFICTVILLVIVPLVFTMRKLPPRTGPVAAH